MRYTTGHTHNDLLPVNSATTQYNRPVLVLRSFLFWLWMILTTLLMALPVMFGALIARRTGLRLACTWARLNLWGIKFFCGLTCKVQGIENIPAHGCIVMSKHQSTYETYFLASVLNDFVFVAKRSLTLIPIFGWCIYLVKFILIDRKSGRSAIKQMIEQSRSHLANGTHVVVFPEGTRMPVNAAPNYRAGGAIVATTLEAYILPVAHNAGEFWPRMGFIKWPGEITMHIGPPIYCKDKTVDQALQETQTWIEERMQEITIPDRFPYKSNPATAA